MNKRRRRRKRRRNGGPGWWNTFWHKKIGEEYPKKECPKESSFMDFCPHFCVELPVTTMTLSPPLYPSSSYLPLPLCVDPPPPGGWPPKSFFFFFNFFFFCFILLFPSFFYFFYFYYSFSSGPWYGTHSMRCLISMTTHGEMECEISQLLFFFHCVSLITLNEVEFNHQQSCTSKLNSSVTLAGAFQFKWCHTLLPFPHFSHFFGETN